VSSKGSILIVETDDLIRDLLEGWLQEAGYAVSFAASDAGPGDRPYQLVIFDVARPRAVVQKVRALESSYKTPVLVLSARFRSGLAGSAEVAGRLGVHRVLPKPFTRTELLRAVEESVASG